MILRKVVIKTSFNAAEEKLRLSYFNRFLVGLFIRNNFSVLFAQNQFSKLSVGIKINRRWNLPLNSGRDYENSIGVRLNLSNPAIADNCFTLEPADPLNVLIVHASHILLKLVFSLYYSSVRQPCPYIRY